MSEEAAIVEIEAFRVGGKASRGLTAANIDEAIASYNSETDPAPLVFGHPESNDPAHGVIATLRREGAKLITGLKNISEDAINGVREGKFINRSIAFWHPDHSANPKPGKWGIRHLGLLGAASPGIPGMGKLSFSADDKTIEAETAPDTAVIFAEDPTPTITITTKGTKVPDPKEGETVAKTEFDAAVAERDRLQGLVDAAATKAEDDRKAANVKFVDELIEKGLWTPGRKVLLAETLNQLPLEEVQFDADHKGNLADEWRRIFSGKDPVITFEAISPTGDTDDKKPLNAQGIVARANQMVEDAKKGGRVLTFDAALELLESQGAK